MVFLEIFNAKALNESMTGGTTIENNRQQRLLQALVIIAGVYTIAPFLLNAMYNQPAADDYYSAVRDNKTGLMPVLSDSYMHWSGRYFAILVSRINPLLFHSVVAYRWYAVILIALFVIALYVLINQAAGKHFSSRQKLVFTAIIVFLYFSAMPSVPEGFFWFSGAWSYQAGNIMLMFLLVAMMKLKYANAYAQKTSYLFLASLLCICINGCNEISLIITCFCVALFTINSYKQRQKVTPYFTVLCVVCFASAAIAFFAPGNFVRLNNLQEYSVSWAWAFTGGLSITGIYAFQWLLQLAIASLVYIPLLGNPLAEKMAMQNMLTGIRIKRCATSFIGLFVLIQLFVVYVAGGSNIGRIENVVYLCFVFGWFFLLQAFLVQRVAKKQSLLTIQPLFVKVFALLYCASATNIQNNTSTAWLDLLSGKAKKYNAELNARTNLINHCDTDTCYLPSITTVPQTIYFEDIKSRADSTDLWINKAYAAYFNRNYIITTTPPPPPETNMEAVRNMGREMRENVFKH